jgi:glucan 1,4-alpha-glucosidase
MHHMLGPRRTALVALVAASLGLPLAGVVPAVAAGPAAPGGPGALSHFDLARKDCLGTAANTTSKVWYTVAGGMLSDVYAPTIDTTNVESLQYVVTDGATFTDVQARDMTHTVRTTDPGGMSCQVTATGRGARYRIVTDYVTDPARSSVVMRVRLETRARGLHLYLRFDPSVNGNGGGGAANGGADDTAVDTATTALVATDDNTATSALNRDYALPLSAALRADRPFLAASAGYAGTPSDGLAQLDTAHRLTDRYATAPAGNTVLTAELDTHRPATLALGFGQTPAQAVATAGASAHADFAGTAARYAAGWQRYDAGLRRPPAGTDPRAYRLSTNVLKASEDKTFPGAVVASLASPWGQAVSAGDAPGGRAVYFGSYREVFARDLYEAFTGLLAAGDLATARDTVRFLLLRQQLADGRMPRNSLVNGKKAPDTGGDQLDESAYPILMTWQAGLAGDDTLYPHVLAAADFVAAHGPSFGAERWEEQGGYSPSTIAAEIAGLVAAGDIADRHGDRARARAYRATADEFQRRIKGWAVTSTGPYGDGRYFLRLSKTGDPDAAISYGLGNGSVSADQRSVVDAGFLELTRLGELPATDPDVRRSLTVLDGVIRRDTPAGPGWYRYGTDTAGSEDGYGDCWEPDPTACAPAGTPWPTGNAGSGHLWPVLAGERAEQQLQTGDRSGAAGLAAAMRAQASGVGLVPEQAWEDPALPTSPFGTDPTVASIGFRPGAAAGSASPLTWAQAQYVRLAQSIAAGRPVEQPSIVRARYVDHAPPAAVPVTVTSPAEGAEFDAASVTVTGTAPAGAKVDVLASATDSGGTTVAGTTAAADGTWSVSVPTPLGTSVLTVAATTAAGTGYARRTVVSDHVTGTVLLDAADPDGDDSGPGTYAYPTAADFHPGAFDLERFQVVDTGDRIVLRTRLRDLSATFGSPLGAQLLDIYVHVPGAAQTSTAAAYPTRDYTVGDALTGWSRRIEVQGFADPVFVDPAGTPQGDVSVQASAVSRYLTVSVPKAGLGTPAAGWIFTVVLHGQDGFSADQARGFAPTPQPYAFGVCAPGGTAPICAADPATVPRATDVLTPPGVDQTTELDPTLGPVTLHGVPIG